MKKKFLALFLTTVMVLTLAGCNGKQNDSKSEETTVRNEALQNAIDAAQTVLDKEETPFDEETTAKLEAAISAAVDASGADDCSALIQTITEAQTAYEDSILSLKQITAPTDDFVMERLKQVDTIIDMAPVTEERDPNGKLNKQGGYIGCIYFRDEQVDWEEEYIEGDVLDAGCHGGGAIEIFGNVEDAQERDEYLGMLDGLFADSHYVYGTLVIRTSSELSAAKQQELTDKIVQALTYVEH